MFLRRFSRPSALSFVAVTAVAPVATVGVAWTGAACSSDFSTSDAPDASSDAQGVPADDGNSLVVAPPPPPGCNPAAKPSDSPACVDDAYGAFVNSNGDDNADGSKLTPFKTIQHAFTTNRARIYICAGTYDENVSLTKTVQKDLFGGFTCDTWTSSASAVVSVAPASGYALQIVSTASPLRIEGITFQAPPGTSTAPSSIAAFASQATGVAFANDTFLGADGFDNGSAVAGTTRNYDQDAGNVALGGNNGTMPLGGRAITCTCADHTVTTGGFGGEGAGANHASGAGLPGPSNAQASCSATTNLGSGGGSGQPGEPAASGAGAATYGDLSATTWSGAAGTSGGTGTIGQGGGGGAGQNGGQYVNGGGGGGCGGCGGGGGGGGAAGGSSFAFLSFDSSVSFSACLLKTGTPGNGGNGGSGQTGQFGGAPGAPGSGEGCAGGPGGRGGNGGGGGGGAGGLSVDVGYVGMPPSLTTSSTFFASVPAKGGQPGDSAATKGVDGANAATLDLESP